MVDTDKNLNNSIMQLLDDYQKTIFLKTLLYACKIDGKVDDKEVQYIKKMASKYKVNDVKKIFEPTTEKELLSELTCLNERRWALELLKELFSLAHEDDDLGEEEITFIEHVGDALKIEEEKIAQISTWVIDYIIWREQGKIIFEERK